MRVTLHYGQGLAGHNDRTFGHADHIDKERSSDNFYWQWNNQKYFSFEQAEYRFYEQTFCEYISTRNERAERSRHPERATSPGQYLHGKKSQPEEVLVYLGDKNDHADTDTLLRVMSSYLRWHRKAFPQIHVLDCALHVDEEGAPHFHLRQVYVAHDRDGHAIASKDKALKEMGINLPDPSLLAGRANNRKMTYTSICRARLQELARASGLEIETEPREVSRSGRRLADYQAEQARQRAEQAHGEAEQAQTLLQETRAILDRLGDTPALTDYITALESYLDGYAIDGVSMLEDFKQQLTARQDMTRLDTDWDR